MLRPTHHAVVAAVVVFCLVTLFASSAQASNVGLTDLDFKRVHLVDFIEVNDTRHFLFRGNFPTNSSGMQYKELLYDMRVRAHEAGHDLSGNPYMVTFAFNFPGEKENDPREEEFWKANPTLGEYHLWPLGFSGLLPPAAYPEAERNEMCKEGGKVWEWDLMPQRVRMIREVMNQRGPIDSVTGKPRDIAIFVHCAAGCDRTGQVVAAYRLNYLINQNSTAIQKIYQLNVEECGRPPNYFSTSATEWYCVYWTNLNQRNVGDCLHIADCDFLGKCTWPPKNTTHYAVKAKSLLP